jgi:hypothetical protein
MSTAVASEDKTEATEDGDQLALAIDKPGMQFVTILCEDQKVRVYLRVCVRARAYIHLFCIN